MTARSLKGWYTVREVAELLRFTVTAAHPERACRAWLKRNRIIGVRRGARVLLYDGLDIDRVLRGW